MKEKYDSGVGKEVSMIGQQTQTRTNIGAPQAYVDYGDLGIDPEILRRNNTTISSGIAPTVSAVPLSATAKAVAALDGLAVRGTSRVVGGVPA